MSVDNKNREESILIVDDSPDNLRLLSGVLLEEGYSVRAISDGTRTLSSVEKEKPDLILLDIMMPKIDGYEVCTILKEDERFKDIPVIFITAKTQSEDIIKGFESGAVDYITKPFNTAELLARVSLHLELKRSREEVLNISIERKELLHILCHDLNTPMVAMHSFLEMLNGDWDYFEGKKDILMESASSVVQNGLDMIELVRKMRVLEDNKLVMGPVNLKESIAKSRLLLHERLKSKNIELEESIDADLNVRAEKTSLVNSVFNNIISNAIKFSYRDSKIKINVDEEGDYILISILDNGTGMSKKTEENLFDIKKNISNNGTEGERGTGIGMSLIKKFVDLYEGEIKISTKAESHSPDDHGTEVVIKLKKA